MWLRKRLVQYLVRNLLAAVTEDDILRVTSRGWFHKQQKLSPEEVQQLKEDAHSFGDSVLWNYMRNEVRYLANLSMFEKGISVEATIFGRAMLYDIELLEKFLSRCKSL